MNHAPKAAFSMKVVICVLFLAPNIAFSDSNVEVDLDTMSVNPVKQSPVTVLDILHEVLTEATSSFTEMPKKEVSTAKEVSNTQDSSRGVHENRIIIDARPRWRQSLRRSLRHFSSVLRSTTGIAAVAFSATVASAAMAAATVEQEVRSATVEACPIETDTSTPTLKKAKPDHRGTQKFEINDMSQEAETIHGAKLISASFVLVGNTFGLIADSIRISGDTAAGVLGSTVKVVGSAVKSISISFENAGKIIEPNQAHRGRKRLTSERLLYRKVQKLAGTEDDQLERRRNGLILNSRHFASKSMRLVGKVVRGVGDSLLLVGGATETLASSTIGLAEDSVRIFEDIAGSLAAALRPKDPNKPSRVKPKVVVTNDAEDANDSSTNSFFSFGTTDQSVHEDETLTLERPIENYDSLADIFEYYQHRTIDFLEFISDDINGVPSLAPEIFGILGVCYLACVYWISRALSERSFKAYIHLPRLPSPIPRASIPLYPTRRSLLRFIASIPSLVAKSMLLILRLLFRIVFDSRVILLLLFTFAWAYLSWASQIRSFAIQRHAEAKGFRLAIASIGTTVPSRSEPVLWVNALFTQIWQTRGTESTKPKSGRKYPIFVERAMKQRRLDNELCQHCDKEIKNCPGECSIVNGGLEPVLSGIIGNSLMEMFQSLKYAGPKDVAYVSIYSITLGSQPPLIRGVELMGQEHEGERYEYELDVLVLFEDMEIVLDVKLSSLDYALLPSTKISAHSFEASLPLKVVVSSIPEYPYISLLEFSLSKSPECSIGITPLSDDSGLRGIDLGSLPVIRDWIQRAIHDTLSDYVFPKFVSFDFAAWMTSVPETAVSATTDINHLRHKTQIPVKHRSTSSDTVDGAKARHLVGHTAFVKDKHVSSLIRPQTEGSKLAMDIWLKKMDDVNERNENQMSSAEEEILSPLPRMLAQPLALLSPVLVAVVAAMFRANTGAKPQDDLMHVPSENLDEEAED